MFESDASNVINAINDSALRTPFGHIILDITQAKETFVFCSFRHLNRLSIMQLMSLLTFPVGMVLISCGKGLLPLF